MGRPGHETRGRLAALADAWAWAQWFEWVGCTRGGNAWPTDGWMPGLGAQVLDGQMLELWEERAKEVQANGWHWEYQFIDLQVSTVQYYA